MKILIFAGAGTSIELGVPAMVGMAQEFLAHCRQWDVEPSLVEELMEDKLDIEYLIENLDKICDAKSSLKAIASIEEELEKVSTIRSEVEWFVQHMAERVSGSDANLMWGSVLSTSIKHDFTFVTTNYDRAIELAANSQGIRLHDGFEPFGTNEITRWQGFSQASEHSKLIKLHGSTDWYSEQQSADPLKLRHPMPLFGKGTLNLANGACLGSALILPSREKLLTKPPYLRLSQAFLNAGDECEAAMFIGSSLRDSHILDAVKTIASSRPVYVVNPGLEIPETHNVRYIDETASQFLMSTLPSAFDQADPIAILDAVSAKKSANGKSIIELVSCACDGQETRSRRCDAIDRLDQLSIQLGSHLIGQLLGDQDSVVSRYSLGLAAISPNRQQLIEAAEQSPHIKDSLFTDELSLLKELP
tara:strand:- start:1720 stop:2973 length:1254 start_codon:yes stop_codon:yes gene_type:complete